MKKEYTESEALYKAESYCSVAERCVFDVRMKLQQWGMASGAVDKIIENLIEDNFINERRYVDAFIREKQRLNHWGRTKMVQALRMKRLPTALIEEAMKEIVEDDYLSSLSSLLQKKKKDIKARNEYERYGKLVRYALGRGYEMNDIVHCLKKCGITDEYME